MLQPHQAGLSTFTSTKMMSAPIMQAQNGPTLAFGGVQTNHMGGKSYYQPSSIMATATSSSSTAPFSAMQASNNYTTNPQQQNEPQASPHSERKSLPPQSPQLVAQQLQFPPQKNSPQLMQRELVQNTMVSPAGLSYNNESSRVRELERVIDGMQKALNEKDSQINKLTALVEQLRTSNGMVRPRVYDGPPQRSTRGRSSNPTLAPGKPAIPHQMDRRDPIDMRLGELYNATASMVPFERINKGFYRFGTLFVEMDIVNHKLMCKTEGWNRGKYGPVEKFMVAFEHVERENMGMEG